MTKDPDYMSGPEKKPGDRHEWQSVHPEQEDALDDTPLLLSSVQTPLPTRTFPNSGTEGR
jgi:hypothetical protein